MVVETKTRLAIDIDVQVGLGSATGSKLRSTSRSCGDLINQVPGAREVTSIPVCSRCVGQERERSSKGRELSSPFYRSLKTYKVDLHLVPGVPHFPITFMSNFDFTDKTELSLTAATQLAKDYAHAQGMSLFGNLSFQVLNLVLL